MVCTPVALTRVFLRPWTVATATRFAFGRCSAAMLSEPERRERAFTVLRGVQGRAETAFSGRWGPRSAAVSSPTTGQPSPKQGSEGCLEPCRQAFRWPGPRPGSFLRGCEASVLQKTSSRVAPAPASLLALRPPVQSVSPRPLPPPRAALCDGPSRPRPAGCRKNSGAEREFRRILLFPLVSRRGGAAHANPASL